VRCLDAPVSGGDVGAQQGTLSIMVGGDEDVFNEVLPILEVMGGTIVLCGPNGAGQTVKACNQIQVALNLIGMAEALVLGAKAGVDPAIVIQVLSGGLAQSRVMDVRGPRIIRRIFEPGSEADCTTKTSTSFARRREPMASRCPHRPWLTSCSAPCRPRAGATSITRR